MDNYYMKYLKYKNKYNKLKNMIGTNQLGGGVKNIKIDMRPYSRFLKKCVEELNCEISFTFSQTKDDIICEFYKGINMFPEDEQIKDNVSLFNKSYTFAYIAGHTHDNYSKEKLGYKYSIPSARDYTTMIEQYYKFLIQTQYIFTTDGIYKLTLGKKLGDIITICFPEMIFTRFIISRRYNAHVPTGEYHLFIGLLSQILNDLHIILEKPLNIDDMTYEEYIEIMKKDYLRYKREINILPPEAKEYLMSIFDNPIHIDNIADLNSYIDNINDIIGFDLELIPWDEFMINMMIDINIYNFIHSSIKAKENNILTDLLYINNDIEENMKDVINNMDHNNFIILNKVDLDKLFDTIKATPHGEMVIMPK